MNVEIRMCKMILFIYFIDAINRPNDESKMPKGMKKKIRIGNLPKAKRKSQNIYFCPFLIRFRDCFGSARVASVCVLANAYHFDCIIIIVMCHSQHRQSIHD